MRLEPLSNSATSFNQERFDRRATDTVRDVSPIYIMAACLPEIFQPGESYLSSKKQALLGEMYVLDIKTMQFTSFACSVEDKLTSQDNQLVLGTTDPNVFVPSDRNDEAQFRSLSCNAGKVKAFVSDGEELARNAKGKDDQKTQEMMNNLALYIVQDNSYFGQKLLKVAKVTCDN